MRPETAAALNRLNRSFYERQASDFSRTRERPWPGWKRLLEALSASRAETDTRPLKVLDLGCGNGRFGLFLAASLERPIDYLGLDSSPRLLEIAEGRLVEVCRSRLVERDLCRADPSDLAEADSLDLVALLGLLHHLPGLATRVRLLRGVATRLAPGGLLALSFWQFGSDPRFDRRIISWEEHNRSAAESIDLEDLEPGDRLLAWGEEPGPGPLRRYCHFAAPEEADALVERLELDPVDRYFADGASGRLNLYHLLRRSS